MKALRILAIAIVAIIAVLVLLSVFVAPHGYKVERTLAIDAPAVTVFKYIQYWDNWQYWSPWAIKDTTMVVTLEGDDGTAGAAMLWEGDLNISGKGKIINNGVVENAELKYQMEMYAPQAANSEGAFTLTEADGKVNISWTLSGKIGLIKNLMLLFSDMDKMIGKDFEEGLQNLKTVAEAEIADILARNMVMEMDFPTTNYAIIRDTVSFTEIPQFLATAYPQLTEEVKKAKKTVKGVPSAIYFTYDEAAQITSMAAAVPVPAKAKIGSMEMLTIETKRAYMVDFFGDYKNIWQPYMALDLFMKRNNINSDEMIVVEEYVTDPAIEPDTSRWETRIYFITK